jgi:hypothetical protein
MSDLKSLPRIWWFPSTEGLQRDGVDAGTYWAYPLEAQPTIGREADPELTWLDGQPAAAEWGLDTTDAAPTRPVALDALRAVLTDTPAPTALVTMATRPHLQRRMRSFTGCYLDLADRAVPVAGGGLLVHFLSDQQWIRHWLVLVDGNASAPVLSSAEPIGFDLPGDDWREPLPAVVPFDGSVDLTVAADSLEEFLFRFWIENEIAFRHDNGEALNGPFAAYVEALRG